MKTGMSVLGTLAIAALGFISGLVASDRLGFGQSNGVVNVHNASGQGLASLVVEVDSCGHKINILAGAVANDESVEIRYQLCGEGGQNIRATLADGRVITSEEYVESGYRATADVSKNAVTYRYHAL